MKYVLHFMPKALNDLAEIRAYIAADNQVRANTYAEELWSEVQSLKEMPNRCSLAPEAPKKGRDIRHHMVGGYRVLFVVKGSTIKVLRIVHGARTRFAIGRA